MSSDLNLFASSNPILEARFALSDPSTATRILLNVVEIEEDS